MPSDSHRSRRQVLAAGSAPPAVALAGCASLLSADDDAMDPAEPIFEEQFDPPTLFLTWQRDPTSTMTVDWHTDVAAAVQTDDTGDDGPRAATEPVLAYRRAPTAENDEAWQSATGETIYHQTDEFHPDADIDYDRTVHRVELTDLDSDTVYEFRLGTAPIWTFETLPSTLSEPLTFANGGDTDYEGWDPILETLTTHEPRPRFLTICGDLPYADGGTQPDAIERWHSWFDSVKDHLVTDGGRVLPILVGIGNHECLSYYFDLMTLNRHVELEDITEDDHGIREARFAGDPDDARRAWAPYFYTFFAFPGQPGYDVIDIGEYLSIVMLDSYHSNAVAGDQTEWLDGVLADRRDVDHVIPQTHAPIYPSHREDDENYTRYIQDAWLPLFEREGLPIVFGHHDHTTKITPPLLDGEVDPDGLVEVGDGCMGRSPREVHPDREWIEHAESSYCVNVVTVDGETIAVDTIGTRGETLQEIEREVR